SRALGTLSQRENCTLFMTLLAGFEAMLYQHTLQDDMLVCTPVIGRNHSQTKQLIGYFNNILPMRFDLQGDPSLLDVVRRPRQVVLNACRYQELPYHLIVERPRLNHLSISRALFSVDMEWPPPLPLAGLVSTPRDVPTDTADFDLGVAFREEQGRLHGMIKY